MLDEIEVRGGIETEKEQGQENDLDHVGLS
jgi:hypothetical protein